MRRFRTSVVAILAGSLVAAGSASAAPTASSGRIDPQRLSQDVKVLASDAFEGRAPGTAGEEKAVGYIIDRFRQLGLQPAGENGGWTQAVPLVRTQVQGAPVLEVQFGRDFALLWRQSQDVYVNTVRPADRVRIAKAPMVFVGYGVSAPERGWDDFKGVNLRGKIAVFLVNDPDFEAQPGEPAAGRFGGPAMTYYGRWTYKYEEAARRGAAGALIIHDTPGAGYGWSTVIAPRGENYDTVRPNGGADRVALQGWIEGAAANALFKHSGLDLAALRKQARSPAFKPVQLGGLFSADVQVTHQQIQSHNVLAKLTGARHPDETVMYAAHWDAYGVAPKPDAAGGTIRRGAADDGIGIAGLFEIARAFKAGPPPDRTILFGAWTAEERNLLGSDTFGAHPTVDLAKMAANYTIDVLETAGPARDVVLIGTGQNELEIGLAKAAARQGRTITPDAHPEKGLFYRADHFSLAKRGVPVLLMMGLGGGPDLVQGGRAAGDRWVNDYTARCYHQSCDAWSADWDLRGAAQDVDLIYEAGRAVANSRAWPQWNAGSEFKPERDKTAAARR